MKTIPEKKPQNESQRLMKLQYLLLSTTVMILCGCASVPKASKALDASAKSFTPETGNASIYVNRGGGIGTAITFQVILDGRIVGGLAPYTFHLLSVSPGEHSIGISSTENIQQAGVMAEEGRNYFYDVDVSMGWMVGRASLKQVSEEAGRKMILKSKLALSCSSCASWFNYEVKGARHGRFRPVSNLGLGPGWKHPDKSRIRQILGKKVKDWSKHNRLLPPALEWIA